MFIMPHAAILRATGAIDFDFVLPLLLLQKKLKLLMCLYLISTCCDVHHDPSGLVDL